MTTLIPNASKFQQALSTAMRAGLDLPANINVLIDPDLCPLAFLPFLAWANSVDYWDEDWPEATKRLAIKSAPEIHDHKGTIYAIEKCLEIIGYEVGKITEWHQETPKAEDGTFKIQVNAKNGFNQKDRILIEHMIDIAKRKSCHLRGLLMSLQTKGRANNAALGFKHMSITVYPYQPESVATNGQIYLAAHSVSVKNIISKDKRI